jgi:DNA helicase-2/ATP-dependent DNA helicase PcrA
VVALDRSYRSTPQILATAASALGDGGRPVTITSERADGPAPTITGYLTDVDEANGVARAVHDLHAPGRPWSAQAVLVRTNAQTALLEAAFRRAAIPHRVRGAGSLLDDPEVRSALRDLDRSREPLATTLADLDAELRAERADLAVGDDLDGDATAAERRLAALEQLVRLGRDLLVVDPHARTEAFSGWLRSTLGDEADRSHDAVAIVTFHAAKGLEWPVVHVAGLEAGYAPISHARTPEARAEERRLLYVALTRAEDVLRCSWAAQRTFGSQTVERRPSPYLEALRATASEVAATTPADPRRALQGTRTVLAEHDAAPPSVEELHADHDLRAALRAWRADEARKGSVRPTVVLSDKAVEALVRARPGTPEELVALADIGPSARERHGARLLAIVADAGS